MKNIWSMLYFLSWKHFFIFRLLFLYKKFRRSIFFSFSQIFSFKISSKLTKHDHHILLFFILSDLFSFFHFLIRAKIKVVSQQMKPKPSYDISIYCAQYQFGQLSVQCAYFFYAPFPTMCFTRLSYGGL